MEKYEIMYILQATLDENARKAEIEKLHGILKANKIPSPMSKNGASKILRTSSRSKPKVTTSLSKLTARPKA